MCATEANAEDRALAARLVSIVVDDETHRGKCSVWQLERYLWLSAHPEIDCNLESTLQGAAAALVAPQQEVLNAYSPMTVYGWLVRFGNLLGNRDETAAIAGDLEDNDWRTVTELLAAKPDVDKLKGAGVANEQAEVLASVIQWNTERPDLLRGLCLPDRRLLLRELLLAFPGESDTAIHALATALCTNDGRCIVSLFQITEFVSRYSEAVQNEDAEHVVTGSQDEGAVRTQKEEHLPSNWKGGGATMALLDVQNELLRATRPPKVEPPPKPQPDPTFVSEWLAEIGLPELCDMFEEQGLKEESDLDKPLFDAAELKHLTKTLGQQRRLLKALKALHVKRDLHVNSSPLKK